MIDGEGTICDFLDAAVKAASDAIDRGSASVFWKGQAECGWQTVASGEDHIKAVIKSPALTVLTLNQDRPAKRLKFGQSASSLEVTQAPSTPDALELW